VTVNILPNGIGEKLGDIIVTGAPLYTSSAIWYVNSAIGNDSNPGKTKSLPFATIGAAYTASSAGDFIVLLDGHTETLTTALAIAKAGLKIVASGQSAGKPTCKLNVNGSSNEELFAITAAGVQLRNIWFAPSGQNQGSLSRIVVTGASFRCIGCYFEQQSGVDLALFALELSTGASNARIEKTTFVSTLTTSLLPQGGLNLSASGLTDVDVIGCTFSGRYGTAAMLVQSPVTRLNVESPTLLLGAELILDAPNPGYVIMPSATQDGLVTW
jgi:hypothetical protein